MDEAPSEDKLADVATKLLADAAFIFADRMGDFADEGQSLVVACIALDCGVPWKLWVAAEERLATALATNMLALDEGAEEAMAAARDSVGEWSNILAGALAAEAEGEGRACSIGVPTVTTEPALAVLARLATFSRKVFLAAEPEGRILVGLQRHEP